MEARGLEPLTLGLQSRCSSQLSHAPGVPRAARGKGEGKHRRGGPRSDGVLVCRASTCRRLPAPSRPARGVRPPAVTFLRRKEVIQPHLPVRLPCYDFTPLTRRTFGTGPLAVGQATSGTPDSDGVTGGVYKARERIHRAMLMRDY